ASLPSTPGTCRLRCTGARRENARRANPARSPACGRARWYTRRPMELGWAHKRERPGETPGLARLPTTVFDALPQVLNVEVPAAPVAPVLVQNRRLRLAPIEIEVPVHRKAVNKHEVHAEIAGNVVHGPGRVGELPLLVFAPRHVDAERPVVVVPRRETDPPHRRLGTVDVGLVLDGLAKVPRDAVGPLIRKPAGKVENHPRTVARHGRRVSRPAGPRRRHALHRVSREDGALAVILHPEAADDRDQVVAGFV